jgi:hypothetical protein
LIIPTRYVASELYEPNDTHRSLGLPLLDWTSAKSKWKSTSPEALFLFSLGLRKFPLVEKILQLAALPDSTIRKTALNYFFSHYITSGYSNSYSIEKHGEIPFVPALSVTGEIVYLPPKEVFTNKGASKLGFRVVDPSISLGDLAKLKLLSDPEPPLLIKALLHNPPTEASARDIFSYLSTQVNGFNQQQLSALSVATIIPVSSEYKSPGDCYFGGETSTLPENLRQIFTTIDFGLEAKPFLYAVGVKNEPSVNEIAMGLVKAPEKFYKFAGNVETYLGLLRTLSGNWAALSGQVKSEMKNSRFILASKRITNVNESEKDEEEEEDEMAVRYELKRGDEVIVNDDNNLFINFASGKLTKYH